MASFPTFHAPTEGVNQIWYSIKSDYARNCPFDDSFGVATNDSFALYGM
jgi:hypothetical protein